MRLALPLAAAGAAHAKSQGDFTEAQAERGANVYAQHCAQCHGANLQGESSPALTGQTFRAAYGGSTAATLYDFTSRQMPQDKPASLSSRRYLDVVAYVLSQRPSIRLLAAAELRDDSACHRQDVSLRRYPRHFQAACDTTVTNLRQFRMRGPH